MEGGIHLAVTMNPTLAALIHNTLYLVGDYTFKQVQGDLDECEFVVWNRATNERESVLFSNFGLRMMWKLGVTVAQVYCNSATCEAFSYVFEALFTSIEKATGCKVKFKVFDPSGNVLAIILDMEAAQAQGLGDALIRLQFNNPNKTGIFETDPQVLVQFLIKLCTQHFDW